MNEMCICDAEVTVRGVKGWEMAAQVVTNTLFVSNEAAVGTS